MIFESKLALRYLISARLQSALIVLGVAIGVLVFTFIAALMNGLGERLTHDITGSVAHITLRPERRVPRTFIATADPRIGRILFAVQPGRDDEPVLRDARAATAVAMQFRGLRAVVPTVYGSATLTRGQGVLGVTVTGVDEARANEIAPLRAAILRGRLDLGAGSILLGAPMASVLGVDVGDRVHLRTTRAPRKGASLVTETTMVVRGVYSLGVQAVDERVVYIDIAEARTLFGMADGVSRLEVKVDSVWDAPLLAERLGRATHLRATSWVDTNAHLQEGLRAQGSTANMIKGFSLLTIALGVASSLMLSVSRRRSDIGILRSFGIARGAILRTFVGQGVLLGSVGALLGCLFGFAFSSALLFVSSKVTGSPPIPIDPSQGEYAMALVLTTVASGFAALLPAWSASRIDPLEAIQS